jgi:large subunit ribosomal protein L31e
MAEKESSKEIERIYVVPLRRAKFGRSSLAAPRAIKQVRGFLNKHMKVEKDDIWIDDSINRELWAKGKYKIPNKIRVRAVKFEDGVVEVTLPELGLKKSRREILKEEKEKKAPVLLREKEEAPAGEGIAGAEDFEIAPTGDGEVKIKKKKAPKAEKTEEKKKPTKKPSAKKAEKKTPSKTKKKKQPKKTTKKSTSTKKEKPKEKKKSQSTKSEKKSE